MQTRRVLLQPAEAQTATGGINAIVQVNPETAECVTQTSQVTTQTQEVQTDLLGEDLYVEQSEQEVQTDTHPALAWQAIYRRLRRLSFLRRLNSQVRVLLGDYQALFQ